jgi:hypothetical protein
MRALATPFRAGLSAAAILLLAACGGSDDEQPDAASTASSPSSSSSATSSATTSDEDVQAFCTEAEAVLTSASESLEAADPTQLGPTLDQAVSELEQLDPPAEISDDWDIATQTFAGLRDAVEGVDLTTPEGQASVQQAVTELEGQATESQARLDAWITENCDNA